MEKGLVFIWAPKEVIFEILEIMEEKSFFYVENLEIINLDRNKAISLSKTCKAFKNENDRQEPLSKADKKRTKEEKTIISENEQI